MSLDYYLFCRKKYNEIIKNLYIIIEDYELINDFTSSEEEIELINKELLVSKNNLNFFLEKKEYILKLLNICELNIQKLCNHDFEDDLIDITPERSQIITYCKICGFTK